MRAMSIGWAALAGAAVAALSGGLPGTVHAAADDPPLVAAAEAGDTGAARDLLAAGADVDAAAVDGATARKLIARGVDVDARMMANGMKDGQRSRLNRLGATAFFPGERDRRMAAELAAALQGGAAR